MALRLPVKIFIKQKRRPRNILNRLFYCFTPAKKKRNLYRFLLISWNGYRRLNYLLNLATPQATGTDLDRLGLSADEGFHFNQVGLPHPPGFVVGVAHVVSSGGSFATDFTSTCHFILPFLNDRLVYILTRTSSEKPQSS